MKALTATRVFTTCLALLGFGFIAVSMVTGDISAEGSVLLDLPWGRMSLVDIYLGVALIAGWAFLREESWWVAALWVPVFIVLGHAGTALYAAVTSFRANSVQEFLVGHRSSEQND